MRELFLAAALLAGWAVLVRRRPFDLFTIGFGAAVVYYLPAFAGRAADVNLGGPFALASRPVEPGAYAALAVVFLALGAGALLYDFRGRTRGPKRDADELGTLAPWAAALGVVGCLATVASAGDALFAPEKTEVLAALDRWRHPWTTGAVVAFVAAVQGGRRASLAVATALLVFDVFVGFRAAAALAMLGAFAVVLSRRGPLTLLGPRSLRPVALALLLGASFFLYKGVYVSVKAGAWDLVRASVLDPAHHAEVVLYSSEPYLVTGTLNEVVRSGFAVEADHYAGLVHLLVPFANELGAEPASFNALFQPTLFPGREGGLAAGFVAEAWSVARIPGVAAVALLWVAGLWAGSLLLASRSALARLFAATLFPAWAFYVHRNDLLYQGVLERRLLVTLVVLALLAAVTREALARPRGAPVPGVCA